MNELHCFHWLIRHCGENDRFVAGTSSPAHHAARGARAVKNNFRRTARNTGPLYRPAAARGIIGVA